MVKNRFSQLVATLTVLAAFTSQVVAQHDLHTGPPRIDANGYDPDLSQPFIEPLAFDPDFQFFAPAGVDRLGGEIDPSIGWFATYDRTYLFVSRPDAEASFVQMDNSWGNRIDVGYMTEEDHGWLLSFLHIDGPNNYNIVEQERINVFEPDDTLNSDPNAVDLRGGGGGGGGTAVVPQPGFPVRDRNDPITLERDYRLTESVNVAKVSGFELNKSFRWKTKHYGSVIEPFFGFRYSCVDDFFQRDLYERFDETTGALVFSSDIPGLFPLPPGVDLDDVSTEQYTTFRSHFVNRMFGGQIGMRWYKQKSRWNLSGEVRAFAMQNFQSLNSSIDAELTLYDGGIAPDVNAVFYDRVVNSSHAAEFVFGTEIRTEAAYSISKNIQIRAGIQFMDFARGIGRGNNIASNDQDILLVGATGGITVNR